MGKDDVRAPAAQIMELLRGQLEESGAVLMQDLWDGYKALSPRELRDGVRMLIESHQLTMQLGPRGPQLCLCRSGQDRRAA